MIAWQVNGCASEYKLAGFSDFRVLIRTTRRRGRRKLWRAVITRVSGPWQLEYDKVSYDFDVCLAWTVNQLDELLMSEPHLG
jgi:hypothetical protein